MTPNYANPPDFSRDYPGDDAHEYEHAYTVFPDTVVRVSAVGGGTLGRTYEDNYWHYYVTDGIRTMRGSDLFIPWEASHEDAAGEAVHFFRYYGEDAD
jgi:hypothetical protein